jgi:hypothetical protein
METDSDTELLALTDVVEKAGARKEKVLLF